MMSFKDYWLMLEAVEPTYMTYDGVQYNYSYTSLCSFIFSEDGSKCWFLYADTPENPDNTNLLKGLYDVKTNEIVESSRVNTFSRSHSTLCFDNTEAEYTYEDGYAGRCWRAPEGRFSNHICCAWWRNNNKIRKLFAPLQKMLEKLMGRSVIVHHNEFDAYIDDFKTYILDYKKGNTKSVDTYEEQRAMKQALLDLKKKLHTDGATMLPDQKKALYKKINTIEKELGIPLTQDNSSLKGSLKYASKAPLNVRQKARSDESMLTSSKYRI